MIVIAIVMLLIVAAAVTLVGVIAFPHQGREMPGGPALNGLLHKVAERSGLDHLESVSTRSADRPGAREGDAA